MLEKIRFNRTLQIVVIIFWVLFVIGTEHFQLHGFQRVVISLIVISVGLFCIIKRSTVATATEASEDTMRKAQIWPWIAMSGFGHSNRRVFLLVIGFVFVLFGILGLFGFVKVAGR